MNVSLSAYIPITSFEVCIDMIIELPEPLKPLQYASGERRPKAGHQMVSDKNGFAMFVDQNPTGFMLFTQKLRFNFVRRVDSEYFMITVDAGKRDLSELLALSVITAFCSVNLAFAFVSEELEYYHRNRVSQKFGGSHMEAWVGRELTKYLPGLYWITIVSLKECKKRAWSFSDLPENCERLNVSEDYLAMKFYGRANEWLRTCEMIDNYCFTHECFFQKKRVLVELDSATDSEKFCQIVRKWK